MRKIPSIVFSLALTVGTVGAIAPMTASAAGATPVTTIENIIVDGTTNHTYVYTAALIANKAACAIQSRRMAIPATGTSSKQLLATVLTALNSGKKVRLIGTGACDGAGSEIVRIVQMLK